MYSFHDLHRARYFSPGYGGYAGRFNRAEGESEKKSSLPPTEQLVSAAVNKGAAMVAAGGAGFLHAYKTMPQVFGLGADIVGGLVLTLAELFLAEQLGAIGTSAVGGGATGLLAYWAATQGSLYGEKKRVSDDKPRTTAKGVETGFDYSGAAREDDYAHAAGYGARTAGYAGVPNYGR